MGITVREHDVLLLLGERLDNRSLAERLHISPRTAEKHVASLLAKTGAVSRDALRDVAVAVRLEPIGPCVGHPGGYAG
jgi:DNA-binding CsgD family transcriptional regulator